MNILITRPLIDAEDLMGKFFSILLLSLFFSGNALSKECIDDTLKKNIQTGKYLFTVSNKLYRSMVLDRLDAALWLPNESLKICHVFDVDGLDSSIMPATGTPEPGGLLWDETLNIIKIAAKNSNIVGADINELSPIKGFNSYNFLVAKLAYKILSYTFKFKR